MQLTLRPAFKNFVLSVLAVSSLLASALVAVGQSTDVSFPTPVLSNEIRGRIAPRDLGDARSTRHFYTFRGQEGDLVIKVESTDLTGDIDLFTGRALRPLLKISLLGGLTTNATRSVYLRSEETLVLRVEARTGGDAEGAYRITLSGAFAPAPADLANAPEPAAPTLPDSSAASRNTRRVTSTGARIEEPPAAASVTESPAPSASPDASTATATRTRPAEERPSTRRGTASARAGRGARTPSRTARNGNRRGEAPAETALPNESAARETPARETPAPAAPNAGRAPARNRRGERRAARSTAPPSTTTGEASGAPNAAAAAVTPPPAASRRLVIVTRDGETIERDMTTVRRVTVENNQLVIVGKDGKIVRQPMTNVQRMSIEP